MLVRLVQNRISHLTVGQPRAGAYPAAPRIGPENLRRFLRRKSLLTQTGPVADIQDDHHLGAAQ